MGGAGVTGALAAQVSVADEAATPHPLFIVHFETGANWEADKPFHEQAHASDHGANLKRLRDAGLILLGARYADKGMLVLRAESEAAVRAEIDRDPMVTNDVFTYTIHAFHPFYEGCVKRGE